MYPLLVMILWSCLTLLLVIILLHLVQRLTMIGRNNLRRNLKAWPNACSMWQGENTCIRRFSSTNARHFGTNGLGSFPKPPENCPKSPELKACFNKEVGSYCQHCQITGHHTRECPIPTRPPPTLPPKYKSQFNEHHFLLSKLKSGKIEAKFIGTQMKEKLPRQLWIPKALVTHVRGPKFAWVPKSQKWFICV